MVKTTVKVEGMMCKNCEAHVNDAVKKAFDVKEVKSSHDNNETVIISEAAPDTEKLLSVINESGYKAISAQSEPYQKKGLFGFGK